MLLWIIDKQSSYLKTERNIMKNTNMNNTQASQFDLNIWLLEQEYIQAMNITNQTILEVVR